MGMGLGTIDNATFSAGIPGSGEGPREAGRSSLQLVGGTGSDPNHGGRCYGGLGGNRGWGWKSGMELGDVGSQRVHGRVLRGFLLVLPSTSRGYPSLPVLRSVGGPLLRISLGQMRPVASWLYPHSIYFTTKSNGHSTG